MSKVSQMDLLYLSIAAHEPTAEERAEVERLWRLEPTAEEKALWQLDRTPLWF
jgi:hypothetical protein